MNLPEVPNGWRILERDETVQSGDMWSYYSRLANRKWIRARYVDDAQLSYNVYIRKVK